jgi:flagellar biosynthesis protein FlhF
MKLLKHLMTMGIGPVLCNEIADNLQENSDFNILWRQAMRELSSRIPVTGDVVLQEGGVVALVGPTGVGKTTTAAKLAARCVMRHGPKSVALVTMDNYRVAAHEQIRVYGRILGIPVRIASNEEELHDILQNLRSKRLVIIDTVGMSQRDARLNNQFSLLEKEDYIKNYLVLSAATQMQSLDESVKSFSSLNLDGCMLTKLDESTSLGGALSVAIQKNLPVSYVTDGQRVPEDIHPARQNNLVHSAVEIMKNSDHAITDEWLALAFGDLAVNGNG